MDLKEIRIANFRSFDDQGIIIDNLGKINIFIGKNNSGKSNILRFFKILSDNLNAGDQKWISNDLENQYKRNGLSPILSLKVDVLNNFNNNKQLSVLKSKAVNEIFISKNLKTNKLEKDHPLDSLRAPELIPFQSRWSSAPKETLLAEVSPLLIDIFNKNLDIFKNLIYIPHFREIVEKKEDNISEKSISGANIISKMFEMQNPKLGDETNRNIYRNIQNFVSELVGVDNIRIEIPHDKTLMLIEMYGNRLPLESFGTGIHELVILCSALAIYQNHIVCIEEPEIHIHPELQRKFLRFIKEKTNNTYFISTHSNVFIDYGDGINVYHVTYDGEKSKVEKANTDTRANEILDDLGYKASDLLQSNGIIWVEGPSDRIYLKKWLSLIANDLIEGIDYSIMFYGGKLLSHLSCKHHTTINDEFIELLKLNRNAFVILDRDGFSPKAKLNETKKRIISELGDNKCWVTKGKEIENYLTLTTIQKTFEITNQFRLDENMDFGVSVDKELHKDRKDKINYNSNKIKYAKQIVDNITEADLNILDLVKRINQIITSINTWNHKGSRDEGK